VSVCWLSSRADSLPATTDLPVEGAPKLLRPLIIGNLFAPFITWTVATCGCVCATVAGISGHCNARVVCEAVERSRGDRRQDEPNGSLCLRHPGPSAVPKLGTMYINILNFAWCKVLHSLDFLRCSCSTPGNILCSWRSRYARDNDRNRRLWSGVSVSPTLCLLSIDCRRTIQTNIKCYTTAAASSSSVNCPSRNLYESRGWQRTLLSIYSLKSVLMRCPYYRKGLCHRSAWNRHTCPHQVWRQVGYKV